MFVGGVTLISMEIRIGVFEFGRKTVIFALATYPALRRNRSSLFLTIYLRNRNNLEFCLNYIFSDIIFVFFVRTHDSDTSSRRIYLTYTEKRRTRSSTSITEIISETYNSGEILEGLSRAIFVALHKKTSGDECELQTDNLLNEPHI